MAKRMREEIKEKAKRVVKPLRKSQILIIALLTIIVVSTIVLVEYSVDVTGRIRSFIASDNRQFTEQNARQMALEEFESRGETNLNYTELELEKVTRGDIDYFFISSQYNSIEIEAETGRVNRINNVRQQN